MFAASFEQFIALGIPTARTPDAAVAAGKHMLAFRDCSWHSCSAQQPQLGLGVKPGTAWNAGAKKSLLLELHGVSEA
jgi:hypothetical protein